MLIALVVKGLTRRSLNDHFFLLLLVLVIYCGAMSMSVSLLC